MVDGNLMFLNMTYLIDERLINDENVVANDVDYVRWK
jgi:hypothetical protein